MSEAAGPGELVARGARTHLRRPVAADELEWRALRRASQEFLAPWEPAPPAGHDPCGALAYRRFLEGSRDARCERYLLGREGDGVLLGGVNVNEIVRGPFQSAYLGYWIGAPFARQGYMREGLELLLGHAFGPLDLHRLEANIRPENAASIALARGAGFRREGYSPRYLKIEGEWRDHERWAITIEDWQAARRG